MTHVAMTVAMGAGIGRRVSTTRAAATVRPSGLGP